MDKFETQSGGGHLKEGHEESDLSIRGIILFGVFLAVGGVLAFVLMLGMIWFLEKQEQNSQAKLTPVEQQLQKQREAPREGLGKETPAAEGELKPAPDWFGRGKMEDHLMQTFKSPRLQYDDEHDMRGFYASEEKWLGLGPESARNPQESTGRLPDGSIHIPIDRAITLLAEHGLPAVSGPFQPANVGAPSAQYPSGASDSGQAARPPAAGVKK
jgi:hypothetical protein